MTALRAAVLAGLTLARPLQAGTLDHWHWRSPAPFANRMLSVTFGAGKFVAVGDDGVIHLSANGSAWDDGRRPVTNTLFQVTFANNQFVAVGDQGAIVTSPDGFTWTRRNSGVADTFLAVTYGNGKYFAAGVGGRVALSADGITWSAGYAGANDLTWAAAGNGVYVTSSSGSGTHQVLVSSDGVAWTPATVFTVNPGSTGFVTPRMHLGAYANGRFVVLVQSAVNGGGGFYYAQKEFYTSTDGVTWLQGGNAPGGPSFTPRFLSPSNGALWTAIGSSPSSPAFLTSTSDGSTVSVATVGDAVYLNGLAFGNGKYVSAGDSGKVLTSSDGANWAPAYTTNGLMIRQLALGTNGYRAVSSSPDTSWYNNVTHHFPGPMFGSLDGLGFSPVSSAPSLPYTGIAFDGSNYVAIAEDGALYTSTNGVNWTPRTSNTSQHLLAVVRGPTRWVAVGAGGTIISSPTGAAWTLRFSGSGIELRGAAYGNGVYVVVGVGGNILTSPDGATWDVQISNTTADLNSVQYLNGQFLAVGANGTILTSADGMTWTAQSSGVNRSLTAVAFGDGSYLAVGSDFLLSSMLDPRQISSLFVYNQTVLVQSTNGVDWQDISTSLPVSVNLRSLAFLGGSFWLTGDNGAILQSDTATGQPLLAGSMLPGNAGFALKVALNAPDSYTIQASALPGSGWQDLLCVTNPIAQTWVDTNAPAAPFRFYRIKAAK